MNKRRTIKGGRAQKLKGGLLSRLFKKTKKIKTINKSDNTIRRYDNINEIKEKIRKYPVIVNDRLNENNMGRVGRRGLTLIQYFYYNQDMINLLLEHGADIDKKDLYGKSLLDYYKHYISVHSKQKDTKTKRYCTLDNGGHPFIVDINNNQDTVNVYINMDNDDYVYPPILLNTIKAKRILIGKESPNYKYKWPNNKGDGNSILLQLDKNKYRFIGATIFDFESINGEVIDRLVSNIGSSAVPWPYAVSNNHIYVFELDGVKGIKNSDIKFEEPFFWNDQDFDYIPIKSTIIQERLW